MRAAATKSRTNGERAGKQEARGYVDIYSAHRCRCWSNACVYVRGELWKCEARDPVERIFFPRASIYALSRNSIFPGKSV